MGKGNLIYIIFYGAALLVLMAMPFVFGQPVTTRVAIGNAAPVVGAITTSDDISIPTCGNVTVWCNATITDANGGNDIKTVNATLWDPASTTEGVADDNSTHYTNTNCTLNGGSGSTVNANCSFALQYYANATDWTCNIYANDTSGNVDNNTKTDVTINTLKALGVESTINFGSLAPGATSSDDVNNTVTNCGNVPIDLNLSGTNLTNASATLANISVSSIHICKFHAGQKNERPEPQ
jgi:hypothetical protein